MVIAQQAAEREKREQEEQQAEQARLEEEAKQLRQQEEREAALQAEKDAGIPYIGMPESSIDATRTLGTHGMAKSGWAYKKDGTFKQMTYYWYTNKRTPIFTGWQGDRNAEKRWLLERQYAARAGRKAGYPHNVPLRQFRQRPGRL